MHHRSLFLPEELVSQFDQFFVETKDFIHGKVDWFKNPIPTPDSFKEGNMVNIFPAIKINISTNSEIVEEIMLGTSCSLEEVDSYTTLFQEFHDIFSWSYTEMLGLDPSIVEHHIDTWPDVAPICQKQWPIHPSIQSGCSESRDREAAHNRIHLSHCIHNLGFLIPFL